MGEAEGTSIKSINTKDEVKQLFVLLIALNKLDPELVLIEEAWISRKCY